LAPTALTATAQSGVISMRYVNQRVLANCIWGVQARLLTAEATMLAGIQPPA